MDSITNNFRPIVASILMSMTCSLSHTSQLLQRLSRITGQATRFMSTQRLPAPKVITTAVTATENSTRILGILKYPSYLRTWWACFATKDIDVMYTERESGAKIHFPAETLITPPSDIAGFMASQRSASHSNRFYWNGEPVISGDIQSFREGTAGSCPPRLIMQHIPAKEPWYPITLRERLWDHSGKSSATSHAQLSSLTSPYLPHNLHEKSSATLSAQHEPKNKSLTNVLRHWSSFNWLSRRWQIGQDEPTIKVNWGKWHEGVSFRNDIQKYPVRVGLPHASDYGYDRMPGITAPTFIAINAHGKPGLRCHHGRINVDIVSRKQGSLEYSFESFDKKHDWKDARVFGAITVDEQGNQSFTTEVEDRWGIGKK